MSVAVLSDRTAGSGTLRTTVVRLPLALLVAAVAGALTGLSWQPYGWWPLLLVGLPVFTLLLRDADRSTRLRRGFLLGYVYGLALLAVSINWIHVLGSWVAVLLIAFEALWFGLLGLALRLVGRLPAWPLLAACCWGLMEFGFSRLPFGGFGWTRLAYAAVDTPLAGWLPYVGVAGVSFLVALCGQLVASVAWRLSRRDHPLRSAGTAIALILVLALIGFGLGLVPAATPTASVQVGIVQGNVPGRGIEALGRARSVTNNHLAETVDLMTKARLGQVPMPDFILWPENSTDVDPTRDAVTNATVSGAVAVADRPILVGAVMAGPGPDERQTTALWWDPEQGITARYDKRNLVPFGEWIPFRTQLLPLLPILKQVGAQSVPGTKPGVLDVDVDGRPLKVGDLICFELAYDATVYDTMTHGAQVLVVQSNNATYGGTGQIDQQFAITRARAIETGREIAVATTNGVSGFIDAHGRVQERTAPFTATSDVVTMPIRDAVTPAVAIAPWVDRAVALLGALACLGALIVRRTGRLDVS